MLWNGDKSNFKIWTTLKIWHYDTVLCRPYCCITCNLNQAWNITLWHCFVLAILLYYLQSEPGLRYDSLELKHCFANFAFIYWNAKFWFSSSHNSSNYLSFDKNKLILCQKLLYDMMVLVSKLCLEHIPVFTKHSTCFQQLKTQHMLLVNNIWKIISYIYIYISVDFRQIL